MTGAEDTPPQEAAPTPRLRVRLTPPAEAALQGGHPWVYAEGIRELNRAGLAGELAVIYDRRNRFLGIGLFDPASPIRVRVLYTGKPQPLDTAWWQAHLNATLGRRDGLFGADTDGYRLCNGESDGWPGLILDRYAETLVLKLYTGAWLPRLDEVCELIEAALPGKRLVLRLSRNLAALAEKSELRDGDVLSGPPLDGCVTFLENGIRFEADVLHGQKTGFFLDQRENRARLEKLAAGRDVLNAFSYSGGFSLYAARGGASSVTNVDISQPALDSVLRNIALNRAVPGIRTCRQENVQADVFDWLRAASDRQFDLVILDPPSLARREAQRADAVLAYGRLVRNGIERLRRGGILVAASCSAHVPADEFFTRVRHTARQSGRLFRELATTGHPPDHPGTFTEARYLKCIYLRMD
jgi:23S rRNA (cytosine1962-C5)-methyltransferase